MGGGEPVEIPLPFALERSILGYVPGESALIMTGSNERLLPAARDEAGGWPLWRVPVPMGTPRQIGGLRAWSADLSPDSRTLALTRGRSICLASSDGSNVRELLKLPYPAWAIRWAPDGKRLRFTSEQSYRSGHWVFETTADGAPSRPLWPGHNGDWTADERHYIFGRRGDLYDQAEDLWPSLLRRQPQQLTAGPLEYSFVASSRDAKRLLAYGTLFRVELMRFDPATSVSSRCWPGNRQPMPSPRRTAAGFAWVRTPTKHCGAVGLTAVNACS